MCGSGNWAVRLLSLCLSFSAIYLSAYYRLIADDWYLAPGQKSLIHMKYEEYTRDLRTFIQQNTDN